MDYSIRNDEIRLVPEGSNSAARVRPAHAFSLHWSAVTNNTRGRKLSRSLTDIDMRVQDSFILGLLLHSTCSHKLELDGEGPPGMPTTTMLT